MTRGHHGQHLPIYKTTHELLSLVTKALKHFSRDLRPSLGSRLLNETLKLIVDIYRARATTKPAMRLKHIHAILEGIEVVEPMLQLCHDMQLIPRDTYADALELTTSIGRQAGGWRRDVAQQLDADPLHLG